MRIIAGKYKGKKLKEFEGTDIRPTSDRARQALFNILQNQIVGAVFYDGFCGSGGVGIEALSRGAKQVVFTDVNKKSVLLTKFNLDSVKENAPVLQTSCIDFLLRSTQKFDIIFLDPPYNADDGVKALKVIAEKGLLTEGGLAVYEHRAGDNCPVEGLELIENRKYGICEFSFYRLKT